jgi:hypothetical protein
METPKELFELGWTIPDVIAATGISQKEAETICGEVLESEAEDKKSFLSFLSSIDCLEVQ